MTKFKSMKQCLRDDTGATAIEYSVIAGTMGIMLVPVGTSLGGLSRDLFQTLIDLFAAYQ